MKTERRGRPPRHPWRDLATGQSFDWPSTSETARVAAYKRKKRHGEQYHVAKVTEDGKHLVRVWRIA